MTGVYYNEHDERKAAWLRELIRAGELPAGDVDTRSIVDVEPDDLAGYRHCHFFAGIGGWPYALRLAGWPDDVPVWTGSPPCQPFSLANRRRNESGVGLWSEMRRLVDARRPSVVFGEQASARRTRGRADGSVRATDGPAWIDAVFDDLEAARYACGAVIAPACGVGAPHIRERIYWGARRLADPGGERGRRDAGIVHGSSESERDLGTMEVRGVDHEPVGHGADGHGSPTHGAWRDADWIECRDGKWRPTQSRDDAVADGLPDGMVPCGSGSEPLDAEAEARTMRQRGYGDAIVPQLAATFVQSFVCATH